VGGPGATPWRAGAIPVASSARGFTMIELLVAMAVTAGFMGAAVMLSSQMEGAYRRQMQSADAQQEGRYALEWITRIIRSAGNNPFYVATTNCPTAGTVVMAVRMDPNGNGQNDDVRLQTDVSPADGRIGGITGACDEAGEDITIAYDAANRAITSRDNNTQGAAVARTDAVVSNLQFVYRDASHTVTAVPSAVAYIEARVTVQTGVIDPTTRQPVTYTLSSETRIRNR